jgi:hypothetical protein
MGASGAPSLHDSGFGGFVSPIYDGLAVVGIWGSSVPPSEEDGMHIGVINHDGYFDEDNFAALVCKETQANESMGKRWHDIPTSLLGKERMSMQGWRWPPSV